jgi:hypothetical protein
MIADLSYNSSQKGTLKANAGSPEPMEVPLCVKFWLLKTNR